MYICQGPWNREFRGGTEAGIHNRFHDYDHVRAVHIVHFPNQTLPSVLGVEGYLEGTPIFVRLQDPEAQKEDRKSTRLNSSHLVISYAVFCLKKKKNKI